MLAKLVRELPEQSAGYIFEPKWGGFRCLATRDGDDIELHSRHGRALGSYFPELLGAFSDLDAERWIIDGEVLVCRGGRLNFGALMSRLSLARG